MTHFISHVKTSNASQIIHLFIRVVVHLYSLPKTIILGMDGRFPSHSGGLWKKLGVALQYASTDRWSYQNGKPKSHRFTVFLSW